MKKFLFLLVVFALALGVGCKKKEVSLSPPPPPPPPEKMQTEQDLMKGFISLIPQLEPGKVIAVQVDKEKFISDESEFSVSLFPLEFIYPEGQKYVLKYMFPAVVWKYPTFQLIVFDPENYLTCSEPGNKVWILKESPDSSKPFLHIPTLLVETKDGKFWVLNQKGYEMLLRANWGK